MIWTMTSLLVNRTTRRYFGALLLGILISIDSVELISTHYLFFAWVIRRLRA